MHSRRPCIVIALAAWLSSTMLAQGGGSLTPIGSARGPIERVAYISDEAQDEVFEVYGGPGTAARRPCA